MAVQLPDFGVIVDDWPAHFFGPELACYVQDAAVHQGGVALPGPPQVSVRSLLETSVFMAMVL
jgi:hypothetical protein